MRRDAVATERAINHIDLAERRLLTAIISLAAYDIQQNTRKKRQAEAFLCGQHFQRMCVYLGLDGNSIRDKLVSKESQRQLRANPYVPTDGKLGRPRKHTATTSAYIRAIEQGQQQDNDLSDAELFGVTFEETPDPIIYTHVFDSRSI